MARYDVTLPSGMNITLPLRVLVSHNPPLTYIDTNATGLARYSGLIVDLIPQLFQAAGVPISSSSFAFYETTLRANTGNLVNGSWTPGTVKELLDGRAFFSVAPHTMTVQRIPYMDVVPVSNEGFAMLVRRQYKTSGPGSFVEPFTVKLWILLLATLVLSALCFYLCDTICTKLHNQQVSRVRRSSLTSFSETAADTSFARSRSANSDLGKPGPLQHQVSTWDTSVTMTERGGQHLLEAWLTITQNSLIPRTRGRALQLLYLGFSLFCLLITSAYAAQLTSILTVSTRQPEVASLDQLRTSKLRFCTITNSAISQYFSQGNDVYAREMNQNMIIAPTQDACVEMLRNRTVAAFLQHYVLAAYYATVSPCDLTLVDVGFKPSNLGLCLAAGNPIIPVLNDAMLKLREDGVITALTNRWASTLSQCPSGDTTIADATLTLSQMYVLFFILAAGLGVALVLAGLERWVARSETMQAMVERTKSLGTSFHSNLVRSVTSKRGLVPASKNSQGSIAAAPAPSVVK